MFCWSIFVLSIMAIVLSALFSISGFRLPLWYHQSLLHVHLKHPELGIIPVHIRDIITCTANNRIWHPPPPPPKKKFVWIKPALPRDIITCTANNRVWHPPPPPPPRFTDIPSTTQRYNYMYSHTVNIRIWHPDLRIKPVLPRDIITFTAIKRVWHPPPPPH